MADRHLIRGDQPSSQLSDEDLGKFIDDSFQNAYRDRQLAEVRWLVSLAEIRGLLNYTVNWSQRQILWNPMLPQEEIRVHLPQLLNRVRDEKGRLLSVKPGAVVRPISPTPAAWQGARIREQVLEYLVSFRGLKRTYKQFVDHLIAEGTAAIQVGWDTRAAKGQGDVFFEAVPGWELAPIPSTAIDDAGLVGIIRSKLVSREWLESNLPEAKDEASSAAGSSMAMAVNLAGGRSSRALQNSIQINFVYILPSPGFEQGLECISINKHVYRRRDSLMYKVRGEPALPIVPCRYTSLANTWWGMSFAYPLVNLNRYYDRELSNAVHRSEFSKHGGWLFVPRGTDIKKMRDQRGGIVEWDLPILDEQSKPFGISPPRGLGRDSDLVMQRMLAELDDASSQHEVSRGKHPGRVDSYPGLNLLREGDERPIQGTIANIEAMLERIFWLSTSLAQDLWLETRKLRVTGLHGQPIVTNITGDMLGDPEDVEILPNSAAPVSRSMDLQEIVFLQQNGLMGPDQALKAVNDRIRVTGVKLQSPDEVLAQRENQIFFGDGRTPGAVQQGSAPGQQPMNMPQPDPVTQQGETHLKVHLELYNDPWFQHMASPEVQKALWEHIRDTQESLQVPRQPQLEEELDQIAQQVSLDTP